MLTDFLKWGLPLFFASTATVAGGDGGGSGDATVTEGAGGGEEIADDSSAETTTIGDDTGVSEEPAETGESETEAVAELPEGPRDGRVMPDQMKKALAKLREIDPQAADVNRRAYYEAGDYKRVFPTVNAARDARDLIDSVGGADGITSLQNEATDYARELTAMANGDPGIVDELATDYPGSLPALVGRGLEKLAEINPQAYERMIAKDMANTLRDRGVAHSVERLLELIGDGKQQQAHELATKLMQWIQGVNEFAKSRPADTQTPEAKALATRQAELDRKESNQFRTRVAESVIRSMNESINKALAPMLKSSKLTPQQRTDLVNSIRTHLSKGFEGNQGYQQRMRALLAEGDFNAIRRYISGQLSSDRVSRSVKAVWGLRGFATKPVAGGGRANGGSGGSPAGAVATVATKPQASEIDWKKDPGKMRYIRGEATLKTGKVVRWKWD